MTLKSMMLTVLMWTALVLPALTQETAQSDIGIIRKEQVAPLMKEPG
jgi:hypothetical protein